MISTMRWDCVFRGLDSFVGLVAALILLSLGLEVYALQLEKQADLAGVLLLLYLAAWVGVAAIASLSLILGSVLVRLTTNCR